jgi:hypothetical protein
MAAAAVEKSATFSRDTRYSSRNSQLGMANLCNFDIIDVSTLQRPVLLLGLSTLQSVASGCVYTTKACAAHRPIYTTKACAEPRRVYTTEESASSGRVYIMVSCAAPEGVYTQRPVYLLAGDVYTTGA